MLVLTGSGTLNALAQVDTIPALVGTPHGRLLLAKMAVLVPILGLASRRHAGELFWLVKHGRPARDMPGFENRLEEAQQ